MKYFIFNNPYVPKIKYICKTDNELSVTDMIINPYVFYAGDRRWVPKDSNIPHWMCKDITEEEAFEILL